MATTAKLQLVGVAEAAQLLGWSRSTLAGRRDPGRQWRPGDELPRTFPEPIADLRCGPIWRRAQIIAYRRDVKRRAKMTWSTRYDQDHRNERQRS